MTTSPPQKQQQERRLHARSRVKTRVYISTATIKRKLVYAENLSVGGVFLRTEGLQLKKGDKVNLVFCISLGKLEKLHRRTGVVAHVTNGGTGIRIESVVLVQNNNTSPPSTTL